MRGAMLAFLLVVLGGIGTAQAADQANAIAGTWLTNDGGSRVQITEAQGSWSGKVVWLAQPNFPAADPNGMAGKPKVDRLNPDPALRDRAVMGLVVLSGLRYAGNATWQGGTIYTPATGKSYPCKATVDADGNLELTVGGSVLGRTVTWKRVAAGK